MILGQKKSRSHTQLSEAQSDLTGLCFTKISKNNAGVQSYKLEKFDCRGWALCIKTDESTRSSNPFTVKVDKKGDYIIPKVEIFMVL